MTRFLLSVLTLIACCHYAVTYNILAIVSLPLRSHYMAFQNLFKELAVRGHSVTVMNNFPEINPVPNLKFIDLGQNYANKFTPMNFYETFNSNYLHLYNLYRHNQLSPTVAKMDCENFFSNELVKTHLDENIKYDVIFVEQFGECGLAYAGAVFNAPIIGITSHVLLPSAFPRLGLPFDFSADSYYFSDSTPNPSFYKKIEALGMHFYSIIGKYYIQRVVYDVFNRHLPNVELDIEKVASERIKMMFVYQHFSLTGSRVSAPQIVDIGGIHIGSPKPVPEELEKFLLDADHGAILVSFGSNLRSSSMTKLKMQQFFNAFKKIPQKVIWKLENASLPAGHDNVYTSPWLPILDILCHTKVLALIFHGGMLSLSEAVHCGKPVLAIPFFGDQFGNAARVKHVGLGDTMPFQQLNADNLAAKIRELTSQRMQDSARRISKQWHDRPISVMDNAIYWTEYVARYRDMPAPLPSQSSTWYERWLLDVAVVILAITLIIAIIVYFFIFKAIKFIFNSIFGSRKCQPPKTKSKKKN